MPQTPTDPTKAQVWVTGTAPNQQLEFYIPRGAKGEPGGFNLGADLSTSDLNSITVPGLYRQANTANATLANNYPVASQAGVLTVTEQSPGTNGGTHQSYSPSWGRDGRVLYNRTKMNGSWQPWRTLASTRVDQTAGRVIYQWDDLNNREQLVYGDTGQRSVLNDQAWLDALFPTNMAPNGGGIVRVRRVGYEVELMVALDKNATGSISAASSFPLGFRPAQPVHALGANSGFVYVRAYHGGGTNGINWNSQAVAVAASVTLKYTTVDPWPTTLPGTAIGGIPNL